MRHDLGEALNKINGSGKISLNLKERTKQFLHRLNESAQGSRYLDIANFAFGAELSELDRAVWQMRRYCTLAQEPRQKKLRHGFAAPLVRIPGGYLEKIIDDAKNSAREPLLWRNGFFGKRTRKRVGVTRWFKAHNAPLWLNPQILDEVLKYVLIPSGVAAAYRAYLKQQKTP